MRRPHTRKQGVGVASDQALLGVNGIGGLLNLIVQGPDGDLQASLPTRLQHGVPAPGRAVVRGHAQDASVDPEPAAAARVGGLWRHQAREGDPAVAADHALHARRQAPEAVPELGVGRGGPQELADVPWAAVHHCKAPPSYRELNAPGQAAHPVPQVRVVGQMARDVSIPVEAVGVASAILREAAAAVRLAHADALLAVAQEAPRARGPEQLRGLQGLRAVGHDVAGVDHPLRRDVKLLARHAEHGLQGLEVGVGSAEEEEGRVEGAQVQNAATVLLHRGRHGAFQSGQQASAPPATPARREAPSPCPQLEP
mmetsp:Transcript_10302/g.24687  ORF Transcript_10302/g.24687 Transcript_10302/m.24687 type:complete len:312 (-) Transcript_10302:2-937(-)